MRALRRLWSWLDPSEFEEFKAQPLDLCNDAEYSGPIREQTGEHGLAALELRHHRGKGRQTRSSEPALYSDRVQARRCVHTIMLPSELVSRQPPESGDRAHDDAQASSSVLRKAFRKLGVRSRTQLAERLS
jgi:hypothetical protein